MKNTWLNAFVMAVMALVFVACNENESPTDPVATAPNAPTALAAQSVNGTTIGLRWIAPTTGVTPTSYEVEYNAQGTTAKLTKTVATGTSTTIDGLEAGTVYDFVVYAYNGTAKSIASSTVSWAAANRGTGTFRLYSSLNSTNGSGLAVWSDNTAGVKLIAEGGKWDICFDDKTNPADPRIASPGQTDYTVQRPNGDVVFVINGVDVPARITYWGKQYTSVASLDDIFESEALVAPQTGGEKFYSIGSIGGTSNWASVIATKNDDGSFNFGKVLMKRTNGSFVQGTGANAYIEVEVSYQTVKNVPYALRQHLNEKMVRAPRSIPSF